MGPLLDASVPPFCRQLGEGRGVELTAGVGDDPGADAALAEWLLALAPDGTTRAQLTNSRAEAVRAALASAVAHHGSGRELVIVRDGADHGSDDLPFIRVSNTKQLGTALSPWRLGQSRLAELQRAILEAGPENVAMVLFEPIQHAGGCLFAPPDYWPGVRELCDRFGILLAVDEAITGIGRLGAWFATELLEVRADLIILGEGLTSCYAPIGAVLAHQRVAAALAEHDVTPAAASIALRNLEQIEREDVLGNVRRLGPRLADRLAACVLPLPVVADVRGAGLLWAVELTGRQNPIALAATLEDCGLRAHVERTIDRTVIVQLAPPLVYGEADLAALVQRLERVLAQLA